MTFPGKGLGVNFGKPLLLKFANASGPFKKEETQYCVLICSKALAGSKVFATNYASISAGATAELAS